MDTGSSGEDFVVKPRKPYTITKQRERWTEEEHNRFLEALRLYGRAWQRIEEHIGTKTAVQIRSHAQKFFTKLEKEASSKGIPLGQTLDIEIPPPRPKRKPSNPYPRKQCINSSLASKEGKGETSSISNSSSCPRKESTNFEKPASLKNLHRCEALESLEKGHQNGNYSEALTLFQDTPSNSHSSVKDGLRNSLVFRGFVPTLDGLKGDSVVDKRSSTDQEEPKQSCTLHTSVVNDKLADVSAVSNSKTDCSIVDRSSKVGISSQMQPTILQKSHDTPCQVLEKNTDNRDRSQSSRCDLTSHRSSADVQAQVNSNAFIGPSTFGTADHPTNSPIPPIYQVPNFPSVGLFHCNQDAYRSLLNMSSTFSNLLVSTLLQHPAAHAAATLAASLWPSFDADKSKGSSSDVSDGRHAGSQLSSHVNTHPSVAAIAAATVAAAMAWWTTHGLLPFFHPVPNCFAYASATTTPDMMTDQASAGKQDNREDHVQIDTQQGLESRDEDSPDAQLVRGSTSKSLPSSDSDGIEGAEIACETKMKLSEINELVSTTDTGFQESSSNVRVKTKPGHYCESIRNSSSVLEKAGTSKGQFDESQIIHHAVGEAKARRPRSSGISANESWKEVSEEGRLAFQALFSREVLPQSFSPPSEEHDSVQCDKGGDTAFSVDLNSKASTTDTEADMIVGENGTASRSNNLVDSSFSTSRITHPKLKVGKTGFKPYKRCSVEANVSRITGEEEKANKRVHMESKASN